MNTNYKEPEEFERPEVFNDSIYGYIYINYRFIKKLINTSPMQRLRRIKQLSCVHIVFSCAEHSRFGHSLGIYELARRFLETKHNMLKDILNHRSKLLLLTAALLHDVGHGSYSHMFEDIFETNHEHQSCEIIIKHHEITDILDQIDSDFKHDIASIIRKQNKYPLIEQLLTSQLDLDRLDYLKRDAYYAGVSYGYIDSERLLRSMEIDNKNNKIVFKKSSITSIENYLINRYHMYCRVYHHPKVIGFSVILKLIFTRIKDLLEQKYKFHNNHIILILQTFLNNPTDIYAYLDIDDVYINILIFYLKKEKDEILSTLCNDFIKRNIWKYLDNISDKKIKKISDVYKENTKYFTYNKKLSSVIYKEDEKDIGKNILIYKDVTSRYTTLKKESPLINDLLNQKLEQKESIFFYRQYTDEKD